MRARAWTFVLCLVATSPLLLLAQQPPAVPAGEIHGIVTDGAGGVIPGVTVELRGAGIAPRSTVTATDGTYAFKGLSAGSYILTWKLQGFSTQQRPVTLPSGKGLFERVEMYVGAVAEALDVVSSAPAVTNHQTFMRAGVAGQASAPPPAAAHVRIGGHELPNREGYAAVTPNSFKLVKNEPLSTFSADVDTASYANVRRFLHEGRLPVQSAVRIEEMINYFRYDYSEPQKGTAIGLTAEVGACPWAPAHKLVLLGLKTPSVDMKEIGGRNLVFLLDVSGSMGSPDKLPLVQSAMRMFVDTLRPADRVAIVVYAGASGLALPSTPASNRHVIHNAIDQLRPGGSTNGAAGIRLAYSIARENFVRGGVNRVILATDGDFNVGVSSDGELVKLIEKERESGVFLSVLGVGTGNLQDAKMELLADKGNGNYAYLDSLLEARKVLVNEAGATLHTVAKDVKIQIEFNPAEVAAYRLIGYENRLLNNEDFNDDKKDAGEMGAGHTVTALYEIVPAGVELPASVKPEDTPAVNPLVYQTDRINTARATRGELLTFNVRYKEPEGSKSRLISVTAKAGAAAKHLDFASAVAHFGLALRGDLQVDTAGWQRLAERARAARGRDDEGYRGELVRMIELASGLQAIRSTQKPQ